MARLGIEMLAISEMTEFLVSPSFANIKKQGAVIKAEVEKKLHLYRIVSFVLLQGLDSENSHWFLDTDLHSNSLRFPFYLRGIDKIPRNHLRLGKIPPALH